MQTISVAKTCNQTSCAIITSMIIPNTVLANRNVSYITNSPPNKLKLVAWGPIQRT